jgi:hypothetical protein
MVNIASNMPFLQAKDWKIGLQEEEADPGGS